MKKFLEIFEESKTTGKVIAIRMNDDDDDFWLGVITDYNEHVFALNHYGKSGRHDGTIIALVDDIESLDYDNDYNAAYEYLIGISGSPKMETHFTLPKGENWAFELLKSIKSLPTFLSIGFGNDILIFGQLISFDEEQVTLIPIEGLGQTDGKSTYRVSDITEIQFNRIEDIKRQKLYEWRQTKK